MPDLGFHTAVDLGTTNMQDAVDRTISVITPTYTPLFSMLRKERATNTLEENLIDELDDADAANAYAEGADIATGAGGHNDTTVPIRVGNYIQRLRRNVQVSGTAMRVRLHGRSGEFDWQLAHRGMEIRRDMEAVLTKVGAAVAAADATPTAALMAGLNAWIRTNASRIGNGPSDLTAGGIPTVAPTDGTQRRLTQALLNTGMQDAFKEGGEVSVLLCGVVMKEVIANFAYSGDARGATQYSDQRPSSINQATGRGGRVFDGSIDVIVTNYGKVAVVPDRFSRERDLFGLTPSTWSIKRLQPFEVIRTAKTGDSQRAFIQTEVTLCSKNEKANFGIFDLDETLAMTAS